MTLGHILTIVESVARTVTPLLPAAGLVTIGAALTKSIVDDLGQRGLSVTDDSGAVLPPEVLAAQVQATFDAAIAQAQEGIDVARREQERDE